MTTYHQAFGDLASLPGSTDLVVVHLQLFLEHHAGAREEEVVEANDGYQWPCTSSVLHAASAAQYTPSAPRSERNVATGPVLFNLSLGGPAGIGSHLDRLGFVVDIAFNVELVALPAILDV